MYKCAKTEALLVKGKGLRRRMDEDTGMLEAVDLTSFRATHSELAADGEPLRIFENCVSLYLSHSFLSSESLNQKRENPAPNDS